MAKVLNKQNINGKLMKMVEIGDEYIINGQLYDKNSFVPKPLQIAPIYGSDKFESTFYRKVFIEQSWNFNRSDRAFVLDINDPNIVWLAVSNPYGTSRIIKLDKKTTGVETTEFLSYAGHNSIEIISQDNDRLYILEHTTTSPYTIVSTINKANLTREFTYSMGNGKYKVLTETNTYVYLGGYVYVANKNVFRVHRYNKFSGAGTMVFEDNESAKATYGMVSNMEIDGSFYAVKNNKPASGADEINFKKYKLNTSTDKVDLLNLPIDWGTYLPKSIPVVEENYETMHEVFMVSDTNGRYLNLIRYNSGNVNLTLSPDRCSIYTFKLENDALKFITETKLSPNVVNGVINMYNNKLLLLGNANGVQFYSWNSANKSYEKTTSFNYPTRMMGVDMNNNIWIQQTDSSMDILSNNLPIQISADFAKQDYDYVGSDIETTVKVEATNFLGDFINASIELTLMGPVEFTSNSSKKLLVTTSPTSALNIPVKITGSGMVRVNTKYFS